MRKLLPPSLLLLLSILLSLQSSGQDTEHLAYWNFNDPAQLTSPAISLTGASITSTLAAGSELISGTGQNFISSNALNGDIAGSHLRLNLPIGSVLNFNIPTVGYSQVVVKYETRRSGSGAGLQHVSYSTDGTNYTPLNTIVVLDGTPEIVTLDFTSIAAANENSNFKIRIEFELGGGGDVGNNRFDNLTVSGINNNPSVDPEVELSFPRDGASRASLKPIFRWVGTAALYTLQVSTSPTFAALNINAQNIATTTYTHPSNLLVNTLYYWRVGSLVGGEIIFSPAFSFTTHPTGTAGRITYFALEARDNAGKIQETIVCDIMADNSIVGVIPAGISNFNLAPTFVIGPADNVTVGGVTQENQWTQANFSGPVTYSINTGGTFVRQYSVRLVHTNLPVVYINTQNSAPILNREDYVAATIRVIKKDGTVDLMAGTEIRGRGNSTWAWPKKPYRLKLNTAASILGFPADRDWVLLANYTDKTLMRNRLAFFTSELMGLSYSPRSLPVEVVLNGVYQGSYQFGDHMKVANDRVNVIEMSESDNSGDAVTGGYFLELDARLDEAVWFRTSSGTPFTLKSPEDTTPEQLNYIRSYIQNLETALFSSSPGDPVNGYPKYMDPESFMKWYWVMELFKNNDANQYSSIFYYKQRNEKLKMGPVWDFDIAAGNIDYNNNNLTSGWWIRNGSWFSGLFRDPAFAAAANQFWNQHRNSIKSTLMSMIDQYASDLSLSQVENFRKWPILSVDVPPNAVVTGSYSGELNYLKTWLSSRIDWINSQVNPNSPTKIVPTIVWQKPAAILPGTPLSGTQLNASATANNIVVPGQFTYTPASGTVLPSGLDQLLQVTFVPTNTVLYESVTGSTTISVTANAPLIYRALNLNGPAMVIDGTNWEASSTAPGYSATNGQVFSNQAVTLVPPTDANRATMIRSSVWGSNVTVSLGSMPAGSYTVYLYVWEDNFSETFTVRMEGQIVQANHASGSIGQWSRLGPFVVNVADGALTVNASGGAANLSGLEIWTQGVIPPTAPTVTAPLIDQVATVGLPMNYTFAANSFSGSGITYAATLTNGNPLPAWLTFTPATRAFTGTPAAGDTAPLAIRVTATNSVSSISDDFNLTVNPVPVMPTVAQPLQDQSVNSGTPFVYVVPESSFSGSALVYASLLSNGSSLPSWLTFTPGTRTFSGTPGALNAGTISVRVTATNSGGSANDIFDITVNSTGAAIFYRALNLNGPALVIDGNNWEASSTAPGYSATNGQVFSNQAVALVPPTDAARATMIRSSVWSSNVTISLGSMPAGSYTVYLYVWEDNFSETFTVRMEGQVVQANHASGSTGQWTKLGPFAVNVADGALTVNASGGAANLSGLEIWTQGVIPPTAPTVTTPLVDQVATVGVQMNYTFAANSFSGSSLTYGATLINGTPLPAWLTFTPATRNFSGTAASGDTGPLAIRVTATNSVSSISDEFNLTVNPAPAMPTVVQALEDQSVNAGTPFVYVIPESSFSGSALVYASLLSNGTSLPSWLTFTPATRTFSGTPGALNAGTISVRVTATNGGGSANDIFDITVNTTGAATFYRALNLNGPALVIDGNNWEASSTAPGYSATNGQLFSNQAVPLVPPTDAARATMIRSSVWNSNVTISLGLMPAGSYTVYLYVWEDNASATYTVTMEGQVVQANYASGNAGQWSKLGPFSVNVADGALTVNATGNFPWAAANLSGLEIWTQGVIPPTAPTVTTPLVDQVATVGVQMNYTFAANSFSGSGINYAATLTNGNPLPAWLTFTPATRAFSGTAASGDTGPLAIRVTATNSVSSVSDEFNLTVDPAPAMPTVVQALQDQSVNAGTPFVYVVPESSFSGSSLVYASLLSNGSTLPPWLTFTPATRTFSGTPGALNAGTISVRVTVTNGGGSANDIFDITVNSSGAATFYRALNLNGPALVIDGNNWEASSTAPGFSTNGQFFSNQAVPLIPATDAARATMIRSSVWNSNVTISLGSMPAGSYSVYLYVWEDNGSVTFTLSMEGQVVQANHVSGNAGQWSRLGPFAVIVSDGTLTINATGNFPWAAANLSGLEIWTQASGGASAGRIAVAESSSSVLPEEESTELSAYPNPFSDFVTIEFSSMRPGATVLTLMDSKGVQLETAEVTATMAMEKHKVIMGSNKMTPGVYVVRLADQGYVRYLRLILMR